MPRVRGVITDAEWSCIRSCRTSARIAVLAPLSCLASRRHKESAKAFLQQRAVHLQIGLSTALRHSEVLQLSWLCESVWCGQDVNVSRS